MLNLNYKSSILICILLSLLFTLLLPFTYLLFGLLLFSILTYIYGKNIILISIIIGQVIVTGEDLQYLRPIINAVSFLVLLYYFFNEYGFNIKLFPKVPRPILIFTLSLLTVILISTFHSFYFFVSLISLVRFIFFFLLVYLFYAQIKDKTSIYLFLSALFFCVVILGFTMISEFVSSGLSYFINDHAILRLAGVYENPNYVGLLIVVTLPIAISFLLIDENRAFINLLTLLIIILMVVLLILADSRASILAITVSFLIILYFSSKKTKIFVSVFAIIITLIIILFTEIPNYFDLYIRIERVGTREEFWNAGLKIMTDNWVLGIGADTFDKVFFSYSPSSVIELFKLGVWEVGKPHPHNLFIYYWAENGILGFCILITFFSIIFMMIFKILKHKDELERSILTIMIGILSISIGMVVRAFFEITGILTYGFITRDLPYWILIIIIMHIYQNLNKYLKKEFY